jgi:hypothetical protein
MLTGTLKPQSRRMAYVQAVELLADEDPYDPIDTSSITSGTAKLCTPMTDSSVCDGTVTVPSGGVVQWEFTKAQLEALAPGTYRLLVGVVADGDDAEIVDCLISLT